MSSRARAETPAVDRVGRSDRPTRRNVFGPAADNTGAEIADRNQSGVSGAITGFVTLQTSIRDRKGLYASSTPIHNGGHKRVRQLLPSVGSVIASNDLAFRKFLLQRGNAYGRHLCPV
jgi:hypothetical protein